MVAAILALRVAGLNPGTLAVGAAVTAVVLGLAAQQTFGNVIAGIVLIGVRPFKVGDRIRLQAGGLAGQVEGVVSSLGLLYTTLAQGGDSVMVPNNVVLVAAVVPLREPASVDLRARLRPDVRPSEVQSMLASIETPVRGEPTIALEELDADEVVVRIQATPLRTRTARSSPTRCWRPSATPRRTATTGSACPPGPSRTVGRRAGAELALDRADRARGERGEVRAGAQRQRCDVELGAVGLDRLDDRAGDVLGALGADVRRQLGAGFGEHAGVADEAGQHHRDADALRRQVLAQRQREAAQAELGRRVDRGAGRGRRPESEDMKSRCPLPRATIARSGRGRAASARAG